MIEGPCYPKHTHKFEYCTYLTVNVCSSFRHILIMTNWTSPEAYLIEDVVVPLRICQLYHPGALQQVRADSRAADPPRLVELNLNKLSEAGGVVIAHSLGISKRLQERVRLQHLQSSHPSEGTLSNMAGCRCR